MTPSSLLALAAEIEGAAADMSEADKRALSDKTLLACGWKLDEGSVFCWSSDGTAYPWRVFPLGSRDDAHRLLPEGWWLYELRWEKESGRRFMTAVIVNGFPPDMAFTKVREGHSPDEMRAVTAAAIRATAAEMEEEG